MMHLLREVEKFLREKQIPPATFGRSAINDSRFVFELRKGREPREATVNKVKEWMKNYG